MIFVKQIGGTALGAAIFIGACLFAPPAQAAYTVTLDQVGSNVVATGSGKLDLAGLSLAGPGGGQSFVDPSVGQIQTGPAITTPIDTYTGFTGPASFGSGSLTFADSGSGDLVGILDNVNQLVVPSGYVSGSSLESSATWDNQTFSSLGVTPGVYVWTWEPPATATDDSFTLDAVAATVSEPASLALLALPLGLVMLLARRHPRAQRSGSVIVTSDSGVAGSVFL
jgi:hypothetical protein